MAEYCGEPVFFKNGAFHYLDANGICVQLIMQGSGGGGAGGRGARGVDGVAGATGATGATGTGAELGYQVYIATLSQTGPNAPVATVLEDTLIGPPIVWTRGSTGSYTGTSAGSFPLAERTFIVMGSSDVLAGELEFYYNWTSTGTIDITDNDAASDDYLTNTAIEIRVYS